MNVYVYSAASPVCLIDTDGLDPAHPEDTDIHRNWDEGQPSSGNSAPAQSGAPAPPVEPDILMEVPTTGPPIDASKSNRGFDKAMGDVAKRNHARMVGKDPKGYAIGHEPKALGIQMPGERGRGVPTTRKANAEKSGRERVEQRRRLDQAEAKGEKAWESENPDEFARPSEQEHARIRAASKAAAAKKTAPQAAAPETAAPKAVGPEPPAATPAPSKPAVSTAHPEPAPKPAVEPPVVKPSAPKGAGPGALEGFAGKIGSITGVFFHVLAVDTLAKDIEMHHDPGSPRLGPVGTRRTDSIGTVWIKISEKEWVTQAYLDNMS
jgi:hypothetical protein